MDKIVIIGGNRLEGEVVVSGSKNAALPVMTATLLSSGKFVIENVPELRDVKTMANLLKIIGADVKFSEQRMDIDTSNCNKFEAPYDLVRTMRASIYVLGPLVSRFGYAKVSLPGGCAWGPRPVNLHLEGLKKLGADITLDQGYIIAKAKRLKGSLIKFDVSSVGATGNIMMAAVLAQGTTVIENAAKEPEIKALAEFLVKMGAKIDGAGTERLEIEGVDKLHPVKEIMIPDRINAGTFIAAVSVTGGRITIKKSNPDHLTFVLSKFQEAGVKFKFYNSDIIVDAPDKLKPINVTTAPYPGFPTDMQAQWTALMSITPGISIVKDTIYLDRFSHIPELRRLGADIQVENNSAIIKGMRELKGAAVMSTDLRASASLIIAGLAAKGRTDVLRVYHIDRGYEKIEEKLKKLGAQIWRERI